ncbi:hypothetical protein [Gordonia terrae]
MARHRYLGPGEVISDSHIRICTYGGSRTEPAEYDELVRCPWCDQWHSADDDVCGAWPVEPSEAPEVHEEDIDWRDWVGAVA